MHYRLPTIPTQLAASAMVSEPWLGDEWACLQEVQVWSLDSEDNIPVFLALMETDLLHRSLTHLSKFNIRDTFSME